MLKNIILLILSMSTTKMLGYEHTGNIKDRLLRFGLHTVLFVDQRDGILKNETVTARSHSLLVLFSSNHFVSTTYSSFYT